MPNAADHRDSTTKAPDPLEIKGGRLQRLFSNTTIYAVGDIGLQLLSAVFIPILTLLLSPAELGTWSMSIMVLIGLGHLFNPAMHGAITRYYYDHEHDETARRRFQGTVATFLFVWALSLSIILTVVGPSLFERLFVDLPFYPYGVFIIWMAFGNIMGVIPKATWTAAERSKIFVGINMLATSVSLIGSIALIMVFKLGVLGLFWGKSLSIFIVAIPYLYYLVKRVGFDWHPSLLKRAMQFSLPLVPHLIAHWVLGMSDRFIIERYLGMNDVGIYASAYVFIEGVNLIAMSMNRAWVPLFTRAFGNEEEHPFIAKSITYFILAVTATTVALTVLSPTIVRAFYEGRYAAAADIASILAAGGFFQGVYYVYVAGLFYHRRNAVIPFITVAGGLTNIGLNLLWIPTLGLRGAAFATLIGYVVLALGVRWGCNRITKLPFEKKRLLKLAAVSVVITAAGVLIDGLWQSWIELIVKLALLIVGVLVLYLTRFWNADERRWLGKILRGRKRSNGDG